MVLLPAANSCLTHDETATSNYTGGPAATHHLAKKDGNAAANGVGSLDAKGSRQSGLYSRSHHHPYFHKAEWATVADGDINLHHPPVTEASRCCCTEGHCNPHHSFSYWYQPDSLRQTSSQIPPPPVFWHTVLPQRAMIEDTLQPATNWIYENIKTPSPTVTHWRWEIMAIPQPSEVLKLVVLIVMMLSMMNKNMVPRIIKTMVVMNKYLRMWKAMKAVKTLMKKETMVVMTITLRIIKMIV